MNQVMAALSQPLLMLLCPIPANGCFVRNLAFAALPMARLMAALSVIWVLLLCLWPGSCCLVHDLAFATLPMARLMAALFMIWLLLFCLWPGLWLLWPRSGFCCFAYGPAHGCFVHDLAFATLPLVRLIAAWSMI